MTLRDIEILTHAAAGRVFRRKESNRWAYFVNFKRVGRAAILRLLREGLLEVEDPGDPSPWRWRQDIRVSVKGHTTIQEREATTGRTEEGREALEG